MGRGAESIYCRYIKRALDILLSALLIFFLCLPMLIIAIAVRSESEGGAIFKQTRRGREGKEFVCYKFRTMYAHAP
ncbi:MAG: sugar transferase, partial [Clostridia bacterium]|nr:sugar transferase [Clostridia bacterium]